MFGGYVEVVKMGLVEFQWWLVLVRARIVGGFGSAVGVVEAPALGARAFNAFARTILLDESITDPAFRQTKE